MTECADRDLLVPAALVHGIAEALDGAVEDGRAEAERIRSAPRSDGYTEEDIEYAQAWVKEATKTRDAFKELRERPTQPALPPIVYGDNAIDSWRTHVHSILGSHVQVTLDDGSHHDGVVRGVGFADGGVGEGVLSRAWWGDGKEPDENTDTESMLISKIREIWVY